MPSASQDRQQARQQAIADLQHHGQHPYSLGSRDAIISIVQSHILQAKEPFRSGTFLVQITKFTDLRGAILQMASNIHHGNDIDTVAFVIYGGTRINTHWPERQVPDAMRQFFTSTGDEAAPGSALVVMEVSRENEGTARMRIDDLSITTFLWADEESKSMAGCYASFFLAYLNNLNRLPRGLTTFSNIPSSPAEMPREIVKFRIEAAQSPASAQYAIGQLLQLVKGGLDLDDHHELGPAVALLDWTLVQDGNESAVEKLGSVERLGAIIAGPDDLEE